AIDPAVQRFIAVLATGFVLFTLLVSGTTLRLLIRMLGLDRLSPFDQALRTQLLALSRDRVVDVVRHVGQQYRFPNDLVSGVAAEYAGAVGTVSKSASTASGSAVEGDADRLSLGLIALATLE